MSREDREYSSTGAVEMPVSGVVSTRGGRITGGVVSAGGVSGVHPATDKSSAVRQDSTQIVRFIMIPRQLRKIFFIILYVALDFK